MKAIAVIGEGAWGTAIAHVLADNGHNVTLWCCDSSVAQQINEKHINNRYMPDFELSKNIVADSRLEVVLKGCDVIFISTPTAFFRSIVTLCAPYYRKKQCWVVLSKGIENETFLLPNQILAQILDPTICCVALGGPSFAQEVMARQLTGVMIAAEDTQQAEHVATLVRTAYFCPSISDDIVGVQLGGALKNVFALLMGISQGAGFSDNTRAFLFTRCWREMVHVARALGARHDTLFDLAGIGDVFLTVTGIHSRNRALGVAIGRGNGVKYEQSATCVLPEGINTIRSLKSLIDTRKISAPLFRTLHKIVFESASATLLLQAVVLSEAV